MPGPTLSYEFQNIRRDLGGVFTQVIEQSPRLIRLVRVGTAARAKKHEWLEDEISAKQYIVQSELSDTDTVITVDSMPQLKDGVVLRFESADGSHLTEQVVVTAVDGSAKTLTISRGYGGTASVTIPANTIAIPLSRPRPEATDPSADWGREPVTQYNYTQIFDRTAKVSRSAQGIDYHGISNMLNYQVKIMMMEIAREMNDQLIFGRRVSWDSGATGSFGGLMEYLESGVLEATGGTLSMDIINNIFEIVFVNGGMSQRYAICAAPNQARRISALMTKDKIPATASTASAGAAVNKLYGDIPAFNGNPYEAFIAVEPNLPKDRIFVLDLDKISLHPLAGGALSDKDATLPGADYIARRILGEYTLEVRNGQTCHGMAVGLTI